MTDDPKPNSPEDVGYTTGRSPRPPRRRAYLESVEWSPEWAQWEATILMPNGKRVWFFSATEAGARLMADKFLRRAA